MTKLIERQEKTVTKATKAFNTMQRKYMPRPSQMQRKELAEAKK
jgi:hypothetical protein